VLRADIPAGCSGLVYDEPRLESFVLPVLGHCRSGSSARPKPDTSEVSSNRGNSAQVNVFAVLSGEISMTKLYVGNLSFDATEDSLRALFAQYGTVDSAKLISDRETGRPRGFGFVEMPNADASKAMQALNGKEFQGRALRVNEAQDTNRSGGRSGGGGGRRY
jgi:RNA recognition motif-containing protein